MAPPRTRLGDIPVASARANRSAGDDDGRGGHRHPNKPRRARSTTPPPRSRTPTPPRSPAPAAGFRSPGRDCPACPRPAETPPAPPATSHSEARAQLLELISRHANVVADGVVPANVPLGIALPPPKLAMREVEAKRLMAERDEEEKLRRHNAVHQMLKRVALRNQAAAARRAKDAPPPAKPDDAAAANARRGQRQGSVYDPGRAARDARAGASSKENLDAASAARREAARRRVPARSPERPWRVGVDAEELERRHQEAARRKRAKFAAEEAARKGAGKKMGWAKPTSNESRVEPDDAAKKPSPAEDPAAAAERQAKARAFILESKARWKKKLAEEKALLREQEEKRAKIKREEEERCREKARLAAEARIRARKDKDADEDAPPKKNPAWVDPGLDDGSSRADDPATPIKRSHVDDDGDPVEAAAAEAATAESSDAAKTSDRVNPGPPVALVSAGGIRRAAAGGAEKSAFRANPEIVDIQGMVQRGRRGGARDPTGKGRVEYPPLRMKKKPPPSTSSAPPTREPRHQPHSAEEIKRQIAERKSAAEAKANEEAREALALREVARRLAATIDAFSATQKQANREKALERARDAKPTTRSRSRGMRDANADNADNAAAHESSESPSSSESPPPPRARNDGDGGIGFAMRANAAATTVQSHVRGYQARRRVASGDLTAGGPAAGRSLRSSLKSPSKAYAHASGRRISFAPKTTTAGGGGGGGDDDDDVEVIHDEELTLRESPPKRDALALAPPSDPAPPPRLLGVKFGPPETHTTLPGDAHVPRREDWLSQGAGGMARKKRLVKRAGQRVEAMAMAPGEDDDDAATTALERLPYAAEDVMRALAPAAVDRDPLPPPPPPPPARSAAPASVFSLYASRVAAAEASRLAAASIPTLPLAAEARASTSSSAQTEPVPIVVERRAQAAAAAAAGTAETPTPTRRRSRPVSPARRSPARQARPPSASTALSVRSSSPEEDADVEIDHGVDADADADADGKVLKERRSQRERDRMGTRVENAEDRAAALAALAAEQDDDAADRLTPSELERQLQNELSLFDELGAMQAELSKVQRARDLFRAEQEAAAYASVVERQRTDMDYKHQLALAKEDMEHKFEARAADLERVALEMTAKMRDESLAQVREVTEMLVSTLRKSQEVERREAAAARADAASFFAREAKEAEEETRRLAPAPDVGASHPAADDAKATAKAVAVVPPRRDDDDDTSSSVDESIPEASILEESTANVRGDEREDEDAGRASPTVVEEDPGLAARASASVDESFEARAAAVEREIAAREKDVETKLRERKRELKARELEEKQRRVRQMEAELLALEGGELAPSPRPRPQGRNARDADVSESIADEVAFADDASGSGSDAPGVDDEDVVVEHDESPGGSDVDGAIDELHRVEALVQKKRTERRKDGETREFAAAEASAAETTIPEDFEIGSQATTSPAPSEIGSTEGTTASGSVASVGRVASAAAAAVEEAEAKAKTRGGKPPKSPPKSRGVESAAPAAAATSKSTSASAAASRSTEIEESLPTPPESSVEPEESIQTEVYSDDGYSGDEFETSPGPSPRTSAGSDPEPRADDASGKISPSPSEHAADAVVGGAAEKAAAASPSASPSPSSAAAHKESGFLTHHEANIHMPHHAPRHEPPPKRVVVPGATTEERARAAVEKHVEAFARRVLDAAGAVAGGVDAATLSRLDDAAFAFATSSSASPAHAEIAERVPDRLVFDTISEILAELVPGAAALEPGEDSVVGGIGSSLVVAAGSAAGAEKLAGDRLVKLVGDRAAASLAPARDGGVKVDDIVREDVRSSDDLGWYDVRATEKAILIRLSEEIFDELVGDTILAGA